MRSEQSGADAICAQAFANTAPDAIPAAPAPTTNSRRSTHELEAFEVTREVVMRALHHCAPPFERLSSLSCKIRTVKAQAMALMSGIWFPTPRDRKYRQGRDLNQDGKSDESHPRLLVAQPSCDTADQPADAMPSII